MMVGAKTDYQGGEPLASFNTTSLPTDVQEVLINERDFLGEIVRSVLQEILELEITEHIGAEPHERTEKREGPGARPVSYTHLRAHETKANLVCRLLLEKKKKE